MRTAHYFIGLGVAALFACLPQTAEAGKVCKNYITSTNTGPFPTRTSAEKAAEIKWGAAVTTFYSLQWANWANASGRSHSCAKKTSAVGANYWRCKAKAKPCIYQ